MTSVHGYYNGSGYVVDGDVAVKPNQRVIITILDDFVTPGRNLKKYVGKVSKADSDLVSEAVDNSRNIDVDEW